MQSEVQIPSDGLVLHGVLQMPENAAPGETRAAFVVLHGFGGHCEGVDSKSAAAFFGGLGYATLRFDFRGCGRSGGERGRVICLEQVRDTQNAITFLQSQPGIAPDCIALAGSSFGAAVAVYTGGIDDRAAAVISTGGWGNGERKFRGQHNTPEAWQEFINMLKQGAEHRARTGESMMVPRFAIVPIPEHLRKALLPGHIMSFPVETAQSMYDFRADDVVGMIAPRPLLLIHAAHDTVTPAEQSLELFRRAGQPSDLHLFADINHFTIYEDQRVRAVVQPWLERYVPSRARAFAAASNVHSDIHTA